MAAPSGLAHGLAMALLTKRILVGWRPTALHFSKLEKAIDELASDGILPDRENASVSSAIQRLWWARGFSWLMSLLRNR
jgi:hypothetical protein